MSRRPREMWIVNRYDIREDVWMPELIFSEEEASLRAFKGESVWRVSGIERVLPVPNEGGGEG